MFTDQDEWCPTCEAPTTIVDQSIEVDVRTIWGTGPEYVVTYLACGHTISWDR